MALNGWRDEVQITRRKYMKTIPRYLMNTVLTHRCGWMVSSWAFERQIRGVDKYVYQVDITWRPLSEFVWRTMLVDAVTKEMTIHLLYRYTPLLMSLRLLWFYLTSKVVEELDHKFIPRQADSSRCGFVLNYNNNSTTADVDYCNKSRNEHAEST